MRSPDIIPFLTRSATAMLAATLAIAAHAGATAISPAPGPVMNERGDAFIETAGTTDNSANTLGEIILQARLAAQAGGADGRFNGINTLEKYRDTAPAALRPVLNAMLARAWEDIYHDQPWSFPEQARAAVDDKNPHTWDAARVGEEIARLYTLSPADVTALQQTPVGAFKGVLHNGDYPGARRPTLFDIVAHQAIEFFSGGSALAPQSEDNLPSPDGAILGPAEEFLAWQPKSPPAASAHFRALALFQDIMHFHQAAEARTAAFADADLQRILWARQILGDTGSVRPRVEQALRAHLERWKNIDVSADTAAELALFHLENGEGDAPAMLDAYKAAMLGIASHPGSHGAKRCRAIVARLEKRELLKVQTELVWNAPCPSITIDSKNIDKIHFRAVRADWKDYLSREHNRPHKLNEKEITTLLGTPPAKTWQVTLPRVDYARTSHSSPAPDDLAPGFYFIIGSVDEKFSATQNAGFCQPVWVSDLAIVHTIGEGKKIEGFVVNAVTGAPVPDATVQAWRRVGANRIEHTPVKTDATGAFSLTTPNPATALLLATAPNGHSVSFENTSPESHGTGINSESAAPERTRHHVKFLTDRSIYRPGQPVHFKAIVYTANNATARYSVAANRKITVVLDDPNHREAARLALRTNKHGSASGTFITPKNRVGGQHTLRTLGAENGRARIQVEEYKRPGFTVTLAKPAIPPRLNETVTIEGNATACTGAPISGAKIRWSVTRNTRLPSWNTKEQETATERIARGTAITDATGKFSITFTATPGKTVTPKDEPQFHYTARAEVTDATGGKGEGTHTLATAHTTIQATIGADTWQTTDRPVALKIRTTDLGNIPKKTTGLVTLYTLGQPEKTLRATLAPPGLANPVPASHDTRRWEEADGLSPHPFTTNAQGEATLSLPLPAGAYRAVLTAQDPDGNAVSARTDILVADPAAPRAAVNLPFRLVVAKNARPLQPGDTFTALWSSGCATARAHVRFEQGGKLIHQFWTDPGRNQQAITFPITEAHRGGLTLRVFQAGENRIHVQHEIVDVPWEDKKLHIVCEKLNSKLTPGSREVWTLRITPPQVPGGNAQPPPEIAATLYDASLDTFAKHQWDDFLEIFGREQRHAPLHFSNHSPRVSIANKLHGKNPGETSLSGVYPRLDSIFSGKKPPSKHHATATPIDSGDPTSGLPRRILGETAFFLPALIAEDDGSVRIEFTAPESLTRWKFLVHAHDTQLRSATFSDATPCTTKDLIVQASPPRLAREGDTLEFTLTLTNTTASPQSGRVRLNFTDARTLAPVDTPLGNTTPERPFDLPPNASRSYTWRITIPANQGALAYKAIAAAGLATDGEEGLLPITPIRPTPPRTPVTE
ncbi:MAG: hypothetical protein LBD14_06900 [Puniceicoccales bacterium]|jgi:hypothetical protein|nr:hypothetical protein [Puniceicoccales bacterium]